MQLHAAAVQHLGQLLIRSSGHPGELHLCSCKPRGSAASLQIAQSLVRQQARYLLAEDGGSRPRCGSGLAPQPGGGARAGGWPHTFQDPFYGSHRPLGRSSRRPDRGPLLYGGVGGLGGAPPGTLGHALQGGCAAAVGGICGMERNQQAAGAGGGGDPGGYMFCGQSANR